jgi:hypothetical protein
LHFFHEVSQFLDFGLVRRAEFVFILALASLFEVPFSSSSIFNIFLKQVPCPLSLIFQLYLQTLNFIIPLIHLICQRFHRVSTLVFVSLFLIQLLLEALDFQLRFFDL